MGAAWHGTEYDEFAMMLLINRADGAVESIEGHPYISPKNVIQRPKVVYSQGTSKYHV